LNDIDRDRFLSFRKDALEKRRNEEIEAGRRANERHRRLDVIARLKKTGRLQTAISVDPDMPPVKFDPNIKVYDMFQSTVFLDGVQVWRGSQNALDNPPEELMAQIAMWQHSQRIELPAPDVTGGKIDEEMKAYHRRLQHHSRCSASQTSHTGCPFLPPRPQLRETTNGDGICALRS
jgi:hypothetical protein